MTQCTSVHATAGAAAPGAHARRPCTVVIDAAAAELLRMCRRSDVRAISQTQHTGNTATFEQRAAAERSSLDPARCHPRCRRASVLAGRVRPPTSGVAAGPIPVDAGAGIIVAWLSRSRQRAATMPTAARCARHPAHNAWVRWHNYSVGCWCLVQYWCQQYTGTGRNGPLLASCSHPRSAPPLLRCHRSLHSAHHALTW